MHGRGVRGWVAAALWTQVLCVCAEEVRVISAADYGARPDDGQDDTPALRLALEAARGKPSRVVFEKGTYDLYRDRAYEQTGESDVIACDGPYPETLITGCVIRNNRARGILLGSRAKRVIENNTFRTFGHGAPFVQMYSVDGLVIRGNRFEKTEAYPAKSQETKRFDITESDNVSISE